MQPQPLSALPVALMIAPALSPAELLRAQICTNSELSFFTEAHNALLGPITKRGGHWASGLSIASSLGYGQGNGASRNQVVDVTEPVVGWTELAHGDSGRECQQCTSACENSVSAVLRCRVYDSCYTNITSSGQRHPLVNFESLSGRLRELKETVAEVLGRLAGIAARIAVHGMDKAISSAGASVVSQTHGVIRLVVTAFCVRSPIVLATRGHDYAA